MLPKKKFYAALAALCVAIMAVTPAKAELRVVVYTGTVSPFPIAFTDFVS